MKLNQDNMCFACGEDNPISLGLEFESIDENRIRTYFTPGPEHQGYGEIMHGGLVSTLLDEVMAKVIYFQGRVGLTASMETRFKYPVPIGTNLEVVGKIKAEKGNFVFTEAVLSGVEGKVYAHGEGKFKVREQND